MWCAHTTNPSNQIAITEQSIPTFPKSSFFPLRGRRYVRLYRILVELEYKIRDAQRIKACSALIVGSL